MYLSRNQVTKQLLAPCCIVLLDSPDVPDRGVALRAGSDRSDDREAAERCRDD